MKTPLFSLGFCLIFVTCKKEMPPGPPLPVVPVLQVRAIEPGLFGFNTGSTFYALLPTAIHQDVAAFWLDSLDCRSFRFPGGSDANFYHWTANGYGYRRGELEYSNSDDSQEEIAIEKTLEKDSLYREKYGLNVREPFAEMANRQPGHHSIYTVNIIHADYEENRAAIAWLLQNGVAITGIELGNEPYLDIHRDSFPTPESYFSKAKTWAAQLKIDFPGLKIGVAGAPFRKSGNLDNPFFFREWNDALAQESFFDAVCWHHYSRFDGCGIDTSSPADWDCVRDSMLRETQERLPVYLKFWKEKFPSKKLWLTEWNLSKTRVDWLASFAGASFFAEYQLELAQFSAENGDFVEFAHHHNLLANGKFPVLRPDKMASGIDLARRQPGFLAFARLKSLFDGTASYLSGEPLFSFENAGRQPVAHSFLTTEKGHEFLKIVVINPFPAASRLVWKQTDKIRFSTGSTVFEAGFSGEMTGFRGTDLTTGLVSETELERLSASFSGNVDLPPFSIVELKILLN